MTIKQFDGVSLFNYEHATDYVYVYLGCVFVEQKTIYIFVDGVYIYPHPQLDIKCLHKTITIPTIHPPPYKHYNGCRCKKKKKTF